MFFSICMPVYNAESYLNDALESVRSQVFPSFEVILVIDTKTSDQSRSVVAEFRRKATNLRIKVLETGFSNVNANRNALIRASEGRYILFFDADDLLPPYCLATLYQVICDHPETTLLLTEKIDFSDAATVVFGAMPEPLQVRSHSSLFHAQKEHYWTSTAALCVRRDEALKFRFDDALEVHGDLDFFCNVERCLTLLK